MAKTLSFNAELCVGCHVCEEVCAQTWFKTTDTDQSSIQIYPTENGQISAVFCNQCGACVNVCPAGALVQDKHGVVRLRKNLCVGCLSCVGFCPTLSMFIHPERPEPFKCIACGKCVAECPSDALAIIES